MFSITYNDLQRITKAPELTVRQFAKGDLSASACGRVICVACVKGEERASKRQITRLGARTQPVVGGNRIKPA